MLKIPYAIADYARLRRENFFYVDRTNYIETLELHGTSFPMFLRPRRLKIGHELNEFSRRKASFS